MNGDGCHILFEVDSEAQRIKFKKICRRQNMSMTRAFNCLMDEVVEGRITFTQRVKIRKQRK